MLRHKICLDTGNNAPFRGRMQVAKQLGAGIMTKVIQDINRGKKLLAESAPIDIHEWDVCTELHGNVDAKASSSPPETHPPAPPTNRDKPTSHPPKLTERDTTSHTPHKTKTKEHSCTPQQNPSKVSPPTKKK